MDQQLLKFVVLEERVIWELFKCDLEGNRQPLDGSGQPGISLDRNELERSIKAISLLAELQQVVADMRRSQKWDGAVEGVTSRVVESLGEHLYRFLFRGELPTKLNDALRATIDGMLRIELEFQGKAEDNYSSWPWEYLRSPREQGKEGSGEFLALCSQLVLNRRLFLPGVPKFKTGRPVVLLVVAGPPKKPLGKYGVVQADKVVSTLRELRDAQVIELIELIEPEFELSNTWRPTASMDAFKKIVALKKPDVIHFIGHGRRFYNVNEKKEYSELIFVGPACKPDPQRDDDFVAAVMEAKANLKLVFLQACESGVRGQHASATSIGELLAHNGIPAVVAMQAKVENIVANDFAEAFYRALREQKPVDWAVREGRQAIRNVSQSLKLTFGVPVLFLRSYEALICPIAPEEPAASASMAGAAAKSAQPEHKSGKPRPFAGCPRCASTALEDVCANCGLRVICACGKVLVRDPKAAPSNPMMSYCTKCGTKHPPPPPWTIDSVEEPPTKITRLPFIPRRAE